MLTAHEVTGEIISGADDEHDEEEIATYGAELVIDLGGVFGIQRFDLKRVFFNHENATVEFRSFNEALPNDPMP